MEYGRGNSKFIKLSSTNLFRLLILDKMCCNKEGLWLVVTMANVSDAYTLRKETTFIL